MFMLKGGIVLWDPDLDMLAEVLLVLDRQLETILDGWQDAAEEAEALGYFDRAEHTTGLGFVACQAYMTATYGHLKIQKSIALTAGPLHRSGQRTVQIINHAANYWKHRDEWHLDKCTTNQTRIRIAFDAIGFPVDLDYPLSGVLTELASPDLAAFKPLVGQLVKWRDDLRKKP
jgi:hypothetical protein